MPAHVAMSTRDVGNGQSSTRIGGLLAEPKAHFGFIGHECHFESSFSSFHNKQGEQGKTKQVYSADTMPGHQHTEVITHTRIPIKII